MGKRIIRTGRRTRGKIKTGTDGEYRSIKYFFTHTQTEIEAERITRRKRKIAPEAEEHWRVQSKKTREETMVPPLEGAFNIKGQKQPCLN